MSTIFTNFASASQRGLTYFLSSATSSSSSSSDSDDLTDLLTANSGLRSTTSSGGAMGGKTVVSVDDMNAASSPLAKLTLAQNVAQNLLVQADASSRTDNATRVTKIADQASDILAAVSSAVDKVSSTDSSGKVLTAYADTLSATLDSVNTALKEVSNLKSRLSSADQSSFVSSLTQMDAQGAQLAKKLGLSWSSVTGNTENSVSSKTATAAATQPRLVDLLA